MQTFGRQPTDRDFASFAQCCVARIVSETEEEGGEPAPTPLGQMMTMEPWNWEGVEGESAQRGGTQVWHDRWAEELAKFRQS